MSGFFYFFHVNQSTLEPNGILQILQVNIIVLPYSSLKKVYKFFRSFKTVFCSLRAFVLFQRLVLLQ